ncbi:MAG: baseplate J/gp47 family protein [Candidatus Limnocylindrales bacterium]
MADETAKTRGRPKPGATPPEATPPDPTPLSLIYLDVDDEITSAAARIRGAGADRVALVLPFGSRLATSRINFRLLAREATERGKQIEIICADASARALALAAGLPVHPSVAAFEGRVPTTPAGGGSPGKGAAATFGDGTIPGAAGASAAGAGSAEPDIDEDTQTRVIALPRRSSPRVPIVGPPRPPMRPRVAVALGVAAVMVVLLGGFLAVEVLPTATIVLHPRSQFIGPLQFTVEARTDVTVADAESLVVPARQVTFSLQATSTFTATGVKIVETKATGNVTFSNFDTGRANEIPAGSIVKTRSGVAFATLATVTLPNATIKFPFTIVPSTSTVGIEAVEPGPSGNVGNNTITVLPKSENKRLLQVTNEQATTGGEEREATEVSAQDVETAQAAIDAALATQLGEQLAAGTGVPLGLQMFAQTAVAGEPEYAVDPTTLIGTEATQFDLSATAEGTALGVDPAPILGIAESRLASRVQPGFTLQPGATPIIGEPSVLGELISYPVSIGGTQVRDVDQAALRASIKGLVLAEARARLQEFGDVEVELTPDWVTKIPTRDDKINFSLGEPQPSASP